MALPSRPGRGPYQFPSAAPSSSSLWARSGFWATRTQAERELLAGIEDHVLVNRLKRSKRISRLRRCEHLVSFGGLPGGSLFRAGGRGRGWGSRRETWICGQPTLG